MVSFFLLTRRYCCCRIFVSFLPTTRDNQKEAHQTKLVQASVWRNNREAHLRDKKHGAHNNSSSSSGRQGTTRRNTSYYCSRTTYRPYTQQQPTPGTEASTLSFLTLNTATVLRRPRPPFLPHTEHCNDSAPTTPPALSFTTVHRSVPSAAGVGRGNPQTNRAQHTCRRRQQLTVQRFRILLLLLPRDKQAVPPVRVQRTQPM